MKNGLARLKICSFFSPPLSLSMFSRNTFITSSQGARLLLPVFCPDFLQKKVHTWLSPLLLALLFFYLSKNHSMLSVFSRNAYHGFMLFRSSIYHEEQYNIVVTFPGVCCPLY